ncbi:MAG: Crp/Fnr family transcriptional regulator, partial [Ginsengibacter sp.]
KPFDGTDLLNAVDSRLKKLDLLKEELAPGIRGLEQLMQASFGKDDLQTFTEGRNTNVYKKKQVIYAEGNHPNRLYYVIRGKVKTYKTNEDGKDFLTEIYTQGDFVGYVALLEETVYKDSAEALEECELAVIPKEDFEDLINRNPQVAKKFIALLAKNVSSKEDQLLSLAYNSLRKKVAEALSMIQKKYKDSENEKFTIDISRENLASIAGTATESLIRTLSDFRNEKLIDIQNGKIRIINEKILGRLAN